MKQNKKAIQVIGNWKQHPKTLNQAKKLFLGVQDRSKKTLSTDKVKVAVAPPFPFISDLVNLDPGGRIKVGSQTVSKYNEGAHTGLVSVPMLKSVGATFVIVGHSEERARGLEDQAVEEVLQNALSHKMNVVLCVGEKKRDHSGDYFDEVKKQIISALKNLSKAQAKYLTIAYEPIWAIGTGKNATPEDVEEMKLFIQKVLAEKCDRKISAQVPIIYGGSVKQTNAEELLQKGNVDGFLIGGASLRPAEFSKIIETAVTYAKKHV